MVQQRCLYLHLARLISCVSYNSQLTRAVEVLETTPNLMVFFSPWPNTFIEKCFNVPNPSQSEFSSTKGQRHLNTCFSLI